MEFAAGKKVHTKAIQTEDWKRNLHSWRPRYDANRNLAAWLASFHKEWIDGGGAHFKIACIDAVLGTDENGVEYF